MLFLAATHSFSSAFIIKSNNALISLAKWQPLKAEALQDAVQDAFAYFSQLPPEEVRSDLKQRGEWYELAQFPSEVLVTPQASVKGCSSQVSIQTGLYQENGEWIIFRFQGDTDATVLRGLIQILSDITQDVPIDEVMSLPAYQIGNALGLQSTLSQSDSNDMGSVWSALQQQIKETLYGNDEDSDYEPSTMGTSIPGAGSSKPAVKKGWSPGSSSNSQSSTSGSAPPFAIWDPTSASAQASPSSSPSSSPPSSSPSDRLSRLDRLSSPSNPKFADGAEVDASANKAPWDNWVPPPPQNSQTTSSDSSSTLGTSIPGAGSSKPATKKGWGPGSSTASDNKQSNASGSAPPFAIWDPTSASVQSSPSTSPPSASPSDRLSRLDRLSSPSTPKFADGAEVDTSANKAPWDNWTPPPPQNTQSSSSDAPSTMGTSIPGAGNAKPAVKKGWGPGSGTSSYNENKQSSTSESAPPFAIWDPTSASVQSSPSSSPPSTSPSDRLSRLDRLSSASTPKFADGAEVDASANKAPWDNWTPPPQKTDSTQSTFTRSDDRSNGTSSSSERPLRVDRLSSSTANNLDGAQFDAAASTPSFAKSTRRNAASTTGKSVGSSDTEPPLGPAFGIETAPKSSWKSDPTTSDFKPLTSSERPPWENGSSRSPQTSLNPLSGKAPDQRWNESPAKKDILQPQEVISSSFKASSSGSAGNFVRNSRRVYDSIPKNDTSKSSTLGPDFVESDRYKIKNPADSSRSVPSTPWRTPSGSSAGGARLDPLYPNSPGTSSVWKASDGIDPFPFTPKNLQTPGVSSVNNPFSPAGVGPQNTFSSTPWTGSTPSTAGAERVTLQPQNFSPASGTMSSWTGSTPSRGSPVGPFQDKTPWGPQNGRASWEPSAFPTKLGDFTTEVNRKPRGQSVRGSGYRSVDQRDGPQSGFREREPFRGRPEGYTAKEFTQANTSFDAEILKDTGNERRSRAGPASESRGAASGPFADRDVGRSSQFKQAKSKIDPLADESIDDKASSTNFQKKNRPSRPRTYLDIVTGNYERATIESQSPSKGDKDFSGPPFNGSSSGPASKTTTRAAPGKETDRFNSEPRGTSTPKTPYRGAEKGTRDLNEPGYETRRVPLTEDGPRPPFRNTPQGARDLNEPRYESRRPPFGGAGQGARDPNEPGYETRRSPFNENSSRSRSEGYRSPPRRPDQKPYVDRIIPTRPYNNEGPPYSPYEDGRVNNDRWQQRGGRIPPPGPSEYYDYRREGPRRPEDERFRYRDDNEWRAPGPGRGPNNGPYDDRMRPRDMMPPRN